jgi:DMSO/TMAO reductase YedYZ molybdopterin-dependent catalytic subunit
MYLIYGYNISSAIAHVLKDTIMKTKTRKQHFKNGFIAGLVAGVVATVVMLLLNTLANGISLPEIFGSMLTALMPASLFDYLHQTIGADAKHYLFYGIVVGQCLVFGLFGGLYNLAVFSSRLQSLIGSHDTIGSPTPKLPTYHGLFFAAILWLLVALLFLPLTGAGLFGSQLSIGPTGALVSLAVVGLLFGLSFVFIQNWLVTRDERRVIAGKDAADSTLGRRALLKRGLIVAGVAVLGVGAWRYIVQGAGSVTTPTANLVRQFKSKIVPPPAPNYGEIHPTKFLSAEITPNDQYYVVSKNLFADPVVNADTWQLTVTGHVEHPFTLSYQELLALPMQQQYESMMCISNEVGGQYMSNALWEGVRLRDLLERAGVKAGASKVVFYAVDDYSDSIHLDKALETTTLLAVHMNGVTLPQGHGFPVRMLVPGIYGMKHCKWLKRVEVVEQDYQGYWQQRGWSDPAPIRMTARIDTPLIAVNVPVNQTTYIGGVAFSGNKGISAVDVSLDAGNTWQRAILERPLSDLTWVRWQHPWHPTTRGTYSLVVRAIDMQGNVQDPNQAPPAPDGSSGYDNFDITVV